MSDDEATIGRMSDDAQIFAALAAGCHFEQDGAFRWRAHTPRRVYNTMWYADKAMAAYWALRAMLSGAGELM